VLPFSPPSALRPRCLEGEFCATEEVLVARVTDASGAVCSAVTVTMYPETVRSSEAERAVTALTDSAAHSPPIG
jgi:hypothetical protein